MTEESMIYSINDLRELNTQIETAHNDNEWKAKLQIDAKGNVSNVIGNYICYLTQCPKYKGKLKYNGFSEQKVFNGEELSDFDENEVYYNIENDLGIFSKQKVDMALMNVFNQNRYNPIIDYLNGVEWDGQKRVESLFIDLLDADDTPLNRYMTKTWFVAAVKSVFEPGCKFDNMIVLQGGQGIGKSSICDLIAPQYSNNISLNEIGGKDLIHKLNRTWIAVVDELDAFNKKEMSKIKTFLSNTKDIERLTFAKNALTYKRHTVFIGSTNDLTFLRDNTSVVERRFWVIKCNKTSRDGKVFDMLTEEYVNQLWAEAVHYYKENPNMYLDISEELMDDFANEMKQFKTYTDDTVIDYVEGILNKKYKLNDKGEFEDEIDFLSQFTGQNDYGELQNSTIKKIPFSYLRYVLKSVYHEDRASSYISNALGDAWKYKTIRYKDTTKRGLERQNCNTGLFNDNI